MGIGTCYCRHKMQHLGKACDAPFEICMTFNNTAASLIRHGFARSIDKKEGIDLLQEAYDNNLVHFGAHKVVVMAIERGKLQNLIFDNHVLWNHRALAGVLGVILKLPPIKQILASKKFKPRYPERSISRKK